MQYREVIIRTNSDEISGFIGDVEWNTLGKQKIEAIVNMTPPKNITQVHAFVGLVNYYRDMWARRSHLLKPLTELTSTKVKFKWTDVEQQAFDEIK